MPDHLSQLIVVFIAALTASLVAFYFNWIAAAVAFPTSLGLFAWFLDETEVHT